MGTKITISSPDENVFGSVPLEIRKKELYIRPSCMDMNATFKDVNLPEMYTVEGELLFFVEVPYEALLGTLATIGVEEGAKAGRRVLTLSKMAKNIASPTGSHFINPVYGVDASQVMEYTFTTKWGDSMTVNPIDDQFGFYSNKGITKVLGYLEMAGNVLDVVSIFSFGANALSGGKKELIPFPGALGVMNLPVKKCFDEMDSFLESFAMEMLHREKEKGLDATLKLINSKTFRDDYKYGHVVVSKETLQGIFEGKFETIDELHDMAYENLHYLATLIYRDIETRQGYITVIETIFFHEEL